MDSAYRVLDYNSGKAIQSLRNAIGMTQVGLAEYLGVSVRTVKEWEAGGSYPKTERLKALIVLAIQYQAFPKGSEVEEIHALWRTTHQKRLLHEEWLSALLAEPPSRQEQSEDELSSDTASPYNATLVPAETSQETLCSPPEESQEVRQPHVAPPHGVTLVPAHAPQDIPCSTSDVDKPVETAVAQGWPPSGSHPATTARRRVLAGLAQYRPRMLRQLGRTYRELIDQSLQETTWLELGLTYKPDAVQNATSLLWRVKRDMEQPLPAGTSIVEVYDEAGYELLILGEPGSGKSMLLLELARQLVLRAEQDETHPLPVILPLASWTAKRLKLEDWIAEQMCEIYDIPRTLSAQWMREDAILPLLDGLDEMEESLRPACISAINAYHSSRRPPLVVCSRQIEYQTAAAQKRLKLQSAVVVQPLTLAQVEGYLVQMGQPLTTLYTTLKEHSAMQELVTTPLMLNVLILTYREMGVDHLPDTQVLLQERVWTDYIARMVERKGNAKRYPHARTVSYLRWLAQHMQRRNQTIFYLEHLQPDWLDTNRQRAYDWWAVQLPALLVGILVSLCLTGLFILVQSPVRFFQYGVFGGLLAMMIRGSIQEEGMWQVQGQQKKWKLWGKRMAVSLLIGLLFACSFWLDGHTKLYYWLNDGLIYGIVFGLSSFLLQTLPRVSSVPISTAKNRSLQGWNALVHFLQTVHGKHGLIGVAVGGLAYGLCDGWRYGLRDGWSSGLNQGLFNGLSLGLSFGLSSVLISFILGRQTGNISLVERLRWTRRSLSKGLRLSNHLNVLFPLIASILLLIGLSSGLSSGMDAIAWILVLASRTELSSGLSIGIGYGLIYALSIGISYGLICGLSAGLIYWFLSGLLQGTMQEWSEDRDHRMPNQGIRLSLHNGLIMGIISTGIIGIISIGTLQIINMLHALLLSMLGDMLSYGLIRQTYGIHMELGDLLRYAVKQRLNYTLSFGPLIGISGGLLVCISMGGLAVWQHYVMRFLLLRPHTFPGRAPQFLDDASARFLLRRVGGGYGFIHRLLLDYLAATRESDR